MKAVDGGGDVATHSGAAAAVGRKGRGGDEREGKEMRVLLLCFVISLIYL